MTSQLKQNIKGCIVTTVGPSSDDMEILTEMIEAGLGMIRINLSHGTIDEAKRRFVKIRDLNDSIPIMFDLSGPKIRIGKMESSVMLAKGDKFVLQTEEIIGRKDRVSFSYPELTKIIKPGNFLYLNDGIIQVKVREVSENEIITEVLKPGSLSSRKGINVPNTPLKIFSPTKKDLSDLERTIELEPDFYSLSFVRRADDLKNAVEHIKSLVTYTPKIISKIEHKDALRCFDEIMKHSAGIMIARGDLGIEIESFKVPIIQKELIKKCNLNGVPVIVATQMLESMVLSPNATRAEASDVANAIFDGADAVMLSAETATGNYPVESVRTMADIIKHLQPSIRFQKDVFETDVILSEPEAVARTAVHLAETMNAMAIVAMTRSGNTAKLLSKYRPVTQIIAVTNNKPVYRGLRLFWGITTYYHGKLFDNTDEMIKTGVVNLVNAGLLPQRGIIIVLAGSLLGKPHYTNLIQYYQIEEVLAEIKFDR